MNILKLYKTKKTVFTVPDLRNILDTTNEGTIRNYLSRAKEKWLLENIYYGIWKIVDRDVDMFEFACKLNKNSYISFETVLKKHGIIFQYSGQTVFMASDKSLEKTALGFTFKSIKLKNSILLDPLWVEYIWNYAIASKERAICDRLYISSDYYFDNLENVDFVKLREISAIYNKRVIQEINNLIEKYAR